MCKVIEVVKVGPGDTRFETVDRFVEERYKAEKYISGFVSHPEWYLAAYDTEGRRALVGAIGVMMRENLADLPSLQIFVPKNGYLTSKRAGEIVEVCRFVVPQKYQVEETGKLISKSLISALDMDLRGLDVRYACCCVQGWLYSYLTDELGIVLTRVPAVFHTELVPEEYAGYFLGPKTSPWLYSIDVDAVSVAVQKMREDTKAMMITRFNVG